MVKKSGFVYAKYGIGAIKLQVLTMGFTIIEAIISIFITILLVNLVFQFSAQFYSNLLERSKFNNIFLENYAALDHIARNLSQAPCNKESWLKIADNQIVWRDAVNNIDMGYFMQDQRLYFVTGMYAGDFWSAQSELSTNKKHRKSLLSSCVKEVKFLQNAGLKPGCISSIVCSIVCDTKNNGCELRRVVGLKNGIFV